MAIPVPPVGMESQPDGRRPLTHVAFAGQASRASLDQLENRMLSAQLAQYLAHALSIAADAEAQVVHIDNFGVEHIFTALPSDEVPTNPLALCCLCSRTEGSVYMTLWRDNSLFSDVRFPHAASAIC